MGGTRLKSESWKVKMHAKNASQRLFFFIAFRKISESWNLAVAWKVPPMMICCGFFSVNKRQKEKKMEVRHMSQCQAVQMKLLSCKDAVLHQVPIRQLLYLWCNLVHVTLSPTNWDNQTSTNINWDSQLSVLINWVNYHSFPNNQESTISPKYPPLSHINWNNQP